VSKTAKPPLNPQEPGKKTPAKQPLIPKERKGDNREQGKPGRGPAKK
jgi:hypothetical protein